MTATVEEIRGTVAHLKLLRERRAKVRAAEAAGRRFGQHPVSYTTDPEWLVDMAINRRAGWPDDPSFTRGSAVPVKRWWPGRMVCPIYQYPKTAVGDRFWELWRLSRRLNGRILVRAREVPARYRERLRHRLTWPEDE